jgi:hypothetical protein
LRKRLRLCEGDACHLIFTQGKEGTMDRERVVRYHSRMRLDGMRRTVHARGDAVCSHPQNRN